MADLETADLTAAVDEDLEVKARDLREAVDDLVQEGENLHQQMQALDTITGAYNINFFKKTGLFVLLTLNF